MDRLLSAFRRFAREGAAAPHCGQWREGSSQLWLSHLIWHGGWSPSPRRGEGGVRGSRSSKLKVRAPLTRLASLATLSPAGRGKAREAASYGQQKTRAASGAGRNSSYLI